MTATEIILSTTIAILFLSYINEFLNSKDRMKIIETYKKLTSDQEIFISRLRDDFDILSEKYKILLDKVEALKKSS